MSPEAMPRQAVLNEDLRKLLDYLMVVGFSGFWSLVFRKYGTTGPVIVKVVISRQIGLCDKVASGHR